MFIATVEERYVTVLCYSETFIKEAGMSNKNKSLFSSFLPLRSSATSCLLIEIYYPTHEKFNRVKYTRNGIFILE